MLWETLVTDGHVRAARLRRIQPWLIALGLILIWLGIWIARSGPDIRPSTSFLGVLQERAAKLQQHATRTFSQLPRLQMQPEQAKALPPVTELTELVAAIRKSLTDDNDLPTDDVDFAEMKVDDFWRGDWASEKVAYLESGDAYLFGANVQAGNPNFPQTGRWMGIAKKLDDGRWDYVTLAGNGFAGVANTQVVAPQQIALTLEPFLPEPPPEPKQPSR